MCRKKKKLRFLGEKGDKEQRRLIGEKRKDAAGIECSRAGGGELELERGARQ